MYSARQIFEEYFDGPGGIGEKGIRRELNALCGNGKNGGSGGVGLNRVFIYQLPPLKQFQQWKAAQGALRKAN